ncbi:MAG: NUDIX domain-containing protein [Oscillospiraceae bacterium]
MHLEEKKLSGEQKFDGKIVKLFVDEVELEDGRKSFREVIKHPGGVCVLPLEDDGNVLFVKQFRYPHGKVLTEIPAGKLEYGESHRECGLRELKEETGCTCARFDYLGSLIPTPAYCGEVIHMYLARGLDHGAQKLDAGEFLDIVKIPLDKAVEMVMNNELEDSKTQIAVLKTKLLLEAEKSAH